MSEKEYTESLLEHIAYVQEAGRKIGVPEAQLLIHDESKWRPEEFPIYAKHFFGGGDPENFPKAWLHHIHNNPHHWQHWIFPDGYSYGATNPITVNEGGVLEMPEYYALEMIADWMGASRVYTGSWDMTDWLFKNLPNVRLHSRTKAYVYRVLAANGYKAVLLGVA